MSEALEAQEQDTDFNAGFDGEPTETPASVEAPVVEVPAPPPEPKFRQVTEDEFNDIVSKVNAFNPAAIDRAFGKIGGIERTLDELRAKTPQGEAVEITAEDFADLAAEFPELADLTLRGMQKIASKLKGTGASLDPEKLNSLVSERVEARFTATQEEQASYLTEDHADWREVVGSQAFNDWVTEQPDRFKRKLARTWDADFISEALDKFKDSIAAKQAEADKAAADARAAQAAADANRNSRQQRLEQAVQPRGAGGSAPVSGDADPFLAGFNS